MYKNHAHSNMFTYPNINTDIQILDSGNQVQLGRDVLVQASFAGHQVPQGFL